MQTRNTYPNTDGALRPQDLVQRAASTQASFNGNTKPRIGDADHRYLANGDPSHSDPPSRSKATAVRTTPQVISPMSVAKRHAREEHRAASDTLVSRPPGSGCGPRRAVGAHEPSPDAGRLPRARARACGGVGAGHGIGQRTAWGEPQGRGRPTGSWHRMGSRQPVLSGQPLGADGQRNGGSPRAVGSSWGRDSACNRSSRCTWGNTLDAGSPWGRGKSVGSGQIRGIGAVRGIGQYVGSWRLMGHGQPTGRGSHMGYTQPKRSGQPFGAARVRAAHDIGAAHKIGATHGMRLLRALGAFFQAGESRHAPFRDMHLDTAHATPPCAASSPKEHRPTAAPESTALSSAQRPIHILQTHSPCSWPSVRLRVMAPCRSSVARRPTQPCRPPPRRRCPPLP